MPVVQISCLGHFGRFGNQLFQYAAAKGYARKVGAELEISRWDAGRDLFDTVDETRVISNPLNPLPLEEIPDDRADVNLHGYFQYSRAYDLYTLSDLREWFAFKPWVHAVFSQKPRPKLTAHLRRGDYVTTFASSFCTIDAKCYEAAIDEHGLGGTPITWISEDTPTKFNKPGLEYLEDFYTLMTSDILVRANSTFSFWAGVLGNHSTILSPVIEGLRGHRTDVKFVRGNTPRTADHPNVHDFNIKP